MALVLDRQSQLQDAKDLNNLSKYYHFVFLYLNRVFYLIFDGQFQIMLDAVKQFLNLFQNLITFLEIHHFIFEYPYYFCP